MIQEAFEIDMSNHKAIAAHYENGGNLLQEIEAGLAKLGKSPETVTLDDLGPVDEFHIGGRPATAHFVKQLNFIPGQKVLDVGCGLGGAARYVAAITQSQVTGIDLTEEYINTGQVLTSWIGLDGLVALHHSSVQLMPFADRTFDGGYMIHVGMNIPEKVAAFQEIHRVLRPGAVFGVYDVMQTNEGEFLYPVPWANEAILSHLSTPKAYKVALEKAGFTVSVVNSRHSTAIEFFARMRARAAAGAAPPPLGLHVLMRESSPLKVKNMIENLEAGLISPVEIIATRQ